MPIPGLSTISDDTLFQISNVAVLPAWALLIFLPRWGGSGHIANITTLVCCALYSLLLVEAWHKGHFSFNFSTLKDVASLFSRSDVVYAGWIHYAATDLWLGKCVAADAVARGFPHVLLAPCLLLTMLFAPVGLLAYFILRLLLQCCGVSGKGKAVSAVKNE